ncbi:MAG: Rieske (2Fe-2S) protein [Desulfuromonadales bacterium]
METVPQSRRSFIATLALLVASGSLMVRYLTPRTSGNRQVLVSASITDIPINGALIFRNERLALMRDDKGFYALSLICTHLGCTVIVSEDALSCPCHGSVFDRQGKILKGPADRSLVRLELVEQNGTLQVYGS